MRVGIFADTHDHLAHIRLAVEHFNAAQVDLVLFAGDLVSTIAVPPLRKSECTAGGMFWRQRGEQDRLTSRFQSSRPVVRTSRVGDD